MLVVLELWKTVGCQFFFFISVLDYLSLVVGPLVIGFKRFWKKVFKTQKNFNPDKKEFTPFLFL